MRSLTRLFVILFILMGSYSVCGQEKTTLLNGRVLNRKNDVSNLLVINLNSKKSTITDSLGFFTIEVKLKDSIRFSALQYLTKDISVDVEILNQRFMVVHLVENVINLSEVMVMPYNLTGKIDLDVDRLDIKSVVTSSSLGLPNAEVEVMSQSERLLIEADRGKYVRLATIEDQGRLLQVLGYATVTVIINTHKIMNRVSGRTKSLEEMVARDENMEIEKKIISLFSKQTISDGFNILHTDIDGFLSFCLSQPDFNTLGNAPSNMDVWEYLKTKSIEFKDIDSVKAVSTN